MTIAALGSFFAGCVGTLLIAGFAPLLGAFAEKFRSPEYCSLMLFGLVAAVVLAHGSVLKAVAMVLLGLLFGLVGTDQSGVARFTFGIPELYDGIDFVPVAIGLFGIAEIMSNLDDRRSSERSPPASAACGRRARRRVAPGLAVLRGTAVGSLLGILPGGGAVLSLVRGLHAGEEDLATPERFGKGAVEGVAAPEAANNAGAQTSFIPLLTLGIPSTPVMAVMIGAMMIQGIAPGTAIIENRPNCSGASSASMWIGNLMLVIINLPLIGIWVKLLSVPYRLLFPAILVLCCVGVYSVGTSTTLVFVTAVFALLGYVFVQARLRDGAVPARLRARPADGGEPAPLHGHLVRRARWSSSSGRSLAILLAARSPSSP